MSVLRWRLVDPSTGETWVFPRNPNKMTSPNEPKATTVFARNFNFADDKQGVSRVLQHHRNPYDWQFSGDIRTQAHYEALRDWARRVERLQLRDHFNRTWLIRFDSVELEELKPNARTPWRYSYTAKALIYGRLS